MKHFEKQGKFLSYFLYCELNFEFLLLIISNFDKNDQE